MLSVASSSMASCCRELDNITHGGEPCLCHTGWSPYVWQHWWKLAAVQCNRLPWCYQIQWRVSAPAGVWGLVCCGCAPVDLQFQVLLDDSLPQSRQWILKDYNELQSAPSHELHVPGQSVAEVLHLRWAMPVPAEPAMHVARHTGWEAGTPLDLAIGNHSAPAGPWELVCCGDVFLQLDSHAPVFHGF